MANRYPPSFYDRLLGGPVVQGQNDLVKMADILAPLWPRYQAWKRQKTKEKRRKYMMVAAVLGVLAVLFKMSPGLQWWAFAHLRIAVTMLPKWSGMKISNNDCLIPTIPLSLGGIPDEEPLGVDADCWVCESIHQPKRLQLSEAKLISSYTAWKQPMLVYQSNGTGPGGATIADVMKEVQKPYYHRSDAEPCHVVSNVPHAFEEFLIRYEEYKSHGWFAQWQNCDHDTTKALRTLQKRPEFLPRSFSTMGASWLFLASNYDGQVFREIETTDSWFWMTQLNGEGQLHLKPKTKCEAVCRDMETNLEPGVVALVPTSIWSIGYMPKKGKHIESIAYGVESYQETRI